MRVLITGASGFAGRHATAELLRRGVAVTGTDVAPPPAGAGVPWLPADLTRPEEALRTVEAARPDAVLHLAGQPRVGASFGDPAGTLRANAGSVLHLLEAVRRAAPQARILLVSSCEVYGAVAPDRPPIREDHPVDPVSPYAVSKAAAELLAHAWSVTHGTRVTVLRPFNHTGPGQAPHFVCADFARQVALAEVGRVPPVVSTGRLTHVRDFLDVRDVAAAYADAVGTDLPPDGAYNIASGRGVTLREILETLLGMARKPLETREDPARHRAADIPALVGDATRLRERTGWTPRIGLKQTLQDLLDHTRSAL